MRHREIVPIGLSGNCLEIFESLSAESRLTAILDDSDRHRDTEFEGVPVLPLDRARDFPEAGFLCLVGSEKSYRARAGIVSRIGVGHDRFVTFKHPSAEVSRFAEVGRGTVFYSGALVTSNARIGDHVLIMPRAVVHHDVRIGNYSLIGTGVIIAGGATVGESCYIGSGTAIRNGVTIGDGALVGLGSVVVKDVAPGAVVAGCPARSLAGRD